MPVPSGIYRQQQLLCLIRTLAHTTATDMKVLVLLALVGTACAAAVEYTKEVADARADFQAAFDAAAAGEGPVASYIDYTEDVANARADFQAAFDAAAAGEGPVASYIDYSKDVADARADFQAAYDAAAANEGPVASYLDYTKEVADARANFQAAYDAAAARPKAASLFYPNAFGAFGINSPFLATPTMAAKAPLAYSGLGFPGAYGLHGFYGPYGYPFQLAKAE